ncbi:MAG: rhodanese-like domain-containing protein [Saprospirales bacterium]|nr:MAG: rhodanese-like domain-containing protein [Saprospirales bacterium]
MRSILVFLLPFSLLFAACSGDQNGEQNGGEITGEFTIDAEGTTAEDAAAAGNIEEVRTVKRNLDTETFREEIQSNDAVLIDVRTDREWDNGRIPGSVQMNIHRPEFQENLSAFPRNQKLYFYCASGRRTQEAITIAERLGFHNVSHLSQGINSWQREGFELERD